jgi:carboxypeptidase Taq
MEANTAREGIQAMNQQLRMLRERLGEVADIRAAVSLLEWDQETYMPPKGATARALQIATLSALAHRLATDPAMGDLLRTLRDASDRLDADDAKLVDETLYDYERATKLPERFVHQFAEARSRGYHAWVQARGESAFSVFEPRLDELVALLRQEADLLGYEGSPYNALLEDFERGMTAERLRDIFSVLARRQTALVKRIVDSGRRPDAAWLDQPWNEQAQWDFSVRVLTDMGYDFDAGRQDRSVHPFTMSLDIEDVRVTTRLDPRRLFSGILASMHEGGHALYDQGFLEQDRRTTLAHEPSLGIHESQSRLWENIVGRSLPFWSHYLPVLQAHFPGRLDPVTSEQVYTAINRVEPSLIRVEADECTYNLHIIVRFEIEIALIENQIRVHEVPEAWNAKMKEYLGVDVPDDARGCLQDIHWSHGAFGYFPTYALGNLYSAQLFDAVRRDRPDVWSDVARGDFEPLRTWLRDHVHRHGRRKTAPELIRDATGAEPGFDAYLHYLERKYAALYGL